MSKPEPEVSKVYWPETGATKLWATSGAPSPLHCGEWWSAPVAVLPVVQGALALGGSEEEAAEAHVKLTRSACA